MPYGTCGIETLLTPDMAGEGLTAAEEKQERETENRRGYDGTRRPKPRCLFHNVELTIQVVGFDKALLGRNQCGLITGRFGLCAMFLAGEQPDWARCDRNPVVNGTAGMEKGR
jgi:hypothetical protein